MPVTTEELAELAAIGQANSDQLEDLAFRMRNDRSRRLTVFDALPDDDEWEDLPDEPQ